MKHHFRSRTQAFWQKGRWLLLILTNMLIFWMITSLVPSSMPVLQSPAKLHLASVSSAFTLGAFKSPGADVDPTHLSGQRDLFDARPCAAQPSIICNGVYPAYPPHISVALAVSEGASACFDKQSVSISEPVNSMPGVGVLQIWFFPLCDSYAAQFLLDMPANQITDLRVSINQESNNGFFKWWQQMNHLPPPVQDSQTSHPQPLNQLSPREQGFYEENGLFSPLLYSPSNSVNASVSLTAGGQTYLFDTDFYMHATKTDNFVQ